MDNKTQAVKVTLRPTQIKKIKKIANEKFEGNFSMALRVIIDEHNKENTCKNCRFAGLYTMGWMPCMNEWNEGIIKEVHDGFGCNKWESLNDSK